LLFLAGAAPVWAHSFTYPDTLEFACTDDGCAAQIPHEDQDVGYGYKGTATITVKNTGTIAWGDFHFEIYQVLGFDPVVDVAFDVSDPNEPTISGHTFDVPGWDVDNAVVGATLDLFFYGDPVAVNETVTISVYTDNTVNTADVFGLLFYPTPVPEPGTLLLFGMGALGLGLYGRRAKKL
jgi:hypothetical protein